MLDIETNPIIPLMGRFNKLCGPPSLHPNEQFDEMTIANYISSNILYWDFMLFINVVQHQECWKIDYLVYTFCLLPPITHHQLR